MWERMGHDEACARGNLGELTDVLLGVEGLHGAYVDHCGEVRGNQPASGFGAIAFGTHRRLFASRAAEIRLSTCPCEAEDIGSLA